jgi:hypothetical protein
MNDRAASAREKSMARRALCNASAIRVLSARLAAEASASLAWR